MLKSSELDKLKEIPTKLDQTCMEYLIFGMFKIDIMELVRVKALLTKNFHLSPLDIDKLPMWEYELYINALNDAIKEENEQQKKTADKYHVDEYMKVASPKNIQKMANPFGGQSISSGSIKLPK